MLKQIKDKHKAKRGDLLIGEYFDRGFTEDFATLCLAKQKCGNDTIALFYSVVRQLNGRVTIGEAPHIITHRELNTIFLIEEKHS